MRLEDEVLVNLPILMYQIFTFESNHYPVATVYYL